MALQSIRPISSGSPNTLAERAVAHWMIVSIAGFESRAGCSTSPTALIIPIPPLYGRTPQG